jgi:parvulin-like peptidyl-prolyl isomerase
VSAEVDVQSTGGLHDYAPQGSFNAAYDDYVFSAAIGEISPPLQSPAGQFFIVRVIDRTEQPVTEDQKPG